MKIIKARVRRGEIGEDQMCYPVMYDNDVATRQGLGPGDIQRYCGGYSGGIGRGLKEEWCLFALEDDAVADTWAAGDPDMEVVSEATADALMEQWRVDNNEPEEMVIDPIRIQAITAKQDAGIALSAEDLRALDPEDEMPGINKRLRRVADVVADARQVLTPVPAEVQ